MQSFLKWKTPYARGERHSGILNARDARAHIHGEVTAVEEQFGSTQDDCEQVVELVLSSSVQRRLDTGPGRPGIRKSELQETGRNAGMPVAGPGPGGADDVGSSDDPNRGPTRKQFREPESQLNRGVKRQGMFGMEQDTGQTDVLSGGGVPVRCGVAAILQSEPQGEPSRTQVGSGEIGHESATDEQCFLLKAIFKDVETIGRESHKGVTEAVGHKDRADGPCDRSHNSGEQMAKGGLYVSWFSIRAGTRRAGGGAPAQDDKEI